MTLDFWDALLRGVGPRRAFQRHNIPIALNTWSQSNNETNKHARRAQMHRQKEYSTQHPIFFCVFRVLCLMEQHHLACQGYCNPFSTTHSNAELLLIKCTVFLCYYPYNLGRNKYNFVQYDSRFSLSLMEGSAKKVWYLCVRLKNKGTWSSFMRMTTWSIAHYIPFLGSCWNQNGGRPDNRGHQQKNLRQNNINEFKNLIVV